MDKKARQAIDRAVAAWDPLGLIGMGAPRDEYDCLAASLISRLSRQESPADIVAWLEQEFPAHFGLAGPPRPALKKFVASLPVPAAAPARKEKKRP